MVEEKQTRTGSTGRDLRSNQELCGKGKGTLECMADGDRSLLSSSSYKDCRDQAEQRLGR